MAIEKWGFFSAPQLMWNGASIYSGQLRGPVTLTPINMSLAVKLSLPVFRISVCRGWDSNTKPSALRGKRSNPLRHHWDPSSWGVYEAHGPLIHLVTCRIIFEIKSSPCGQLDHNIYLPSNWINSCSEYVTYCIIIHISYNPPPFTNDSV